MHLRHGHWPHGKKKKYSQIEKEGLALIFGASPVFMQKKVQAEQGGDRSQTLANSVWRA